ncbi:MAG: hypothetical protein OYH77_01680 [Pseudomonadota bacterium]|nr:hypothetical protein [Pseudomonadota bacterium]
MSIIVALLHVACLEQKGEALEEHTVEVVSLGSYTIAKQIRELDHDYQVLSSQSDGGYLLNSTSGEWIDVSSAGKLFTYSQPPELLDKSGTAMGASPDRKVYQLGDAAWVTNKAKIERYTARSGAGSERKYQLMNELDDSDTILKKLFWLSPQRLVGFGEFKTKSCTTESACLKKGVLIFEIKADNEIATITIPIKADSHGLDEATVIGGFSATASADSKDLWLWNSAGELLYLHETKDGWATRKYRLEFSNPNADIVEFDFDIEVSPDDGYLLPPKGIAVIARNAAGKLGLYTALPD